MSDPNSFEIIIREIEHLHADISQALKVILVGFVILFSAMPSCKFKRKRGKDV